MKLDATAQAALVRRGEASPLELVDEAIARIEKLNPQLNAVIVPLFEQARAAARGPLPDGPFRGVPFLLKDLDVTSADDPLHCGTKFLKHADYRAPGDSHIVRLFREAGFLFLGKTNTPEFGLNITTEPESYGPSRNPWNPEHSTGGSSGGSAAAVAGGMVSVAHASDGGGSIRIPASECGLVGLKPSRGRISLGPDYGEYWAGFVTSHVVSHSVRDTATILDCIAKPMTGDPYVARATPGTYADAAATAPKKLRIGLLRHVPTGASEVHPECAAAVDAAGRQLEALGHHVELAYPDAFDQQDTSEHFTTVVTSWTATGIAEWGEKLGREIVESDVEPATWMFAQMGRGVSAPRYLAAIHALSRYTRRMAGWWASGFDVLVTPTLGQPPPKLGELIPPRDNPILGLAKTLVYMPFTPPFNITGQPAVSLPLHWSADGLPIGVQFVGDHGREDVLLSLAGQLECAMPWADRRPPLFAA